MDQLRKTGTDELLKKELAKGKQMTDLVSLFKALGGGWKPLDEETIKGAKNDQNEENVGGEGK